MSDQKSSNLGYYKVILSSEISIPKVSVIVPNYNHAPFLRQRIDSILAQTFQDFELILLDDASTDDSRSILSSYANDPHVSAVQFNEKNSGSGYKQWNKGARLARGKYIWIAESDDYADPLLLERLVAILDADQETAFAYCRSWWVPTSGQLALADQYLNYDQSHWGNDFHVNGQEECKRYFLCANPVVNASAVVFRRTAFELVGGADENLRLCGDWKLWAAMSLTGRIAYLREPMNYFRFHEASVRSRSKKDAADVIEPLQVVRWILERLPVSREASRTVYRAQAGRWVPLVLNRHTSPELKRAVLQHVNALDPHPFWHAVRPALNVLRFKLLRHWRPIRTRAHELWAWWRYRPPTFPAVAQLTASIAALSALEDSPIPGETGSEAPIFLLSTGMRTGSTLLQRILVTDPCLLLWGESMGEMNIAALLSQMLSDFMSPEFFDYRQRQPSPGSPDLAKSWIPHLHPSNDNFRLGLRSLFNRWLGQPARQHGFSRWGFKEVRLDATAAVLLRWLYPNAKFILLTRHPFDCYRSFADGGSNDHYVQHPGVLINSAASFAGEWNRIAVSWSQLPSDFPAMQVRYEDLVSGNFDFRRLESWLGIKLNESEALLQKVGGSAFRPRLHAYERWIISREAAPGMRALGYSGRPAASAKPAPVRPAECVVPEKSA